MGTAQGAGGPGHRQRQQPGDPPHDGQDDVGQGTQCGAGVGRLGTGPSARWSSRRPSRRWIPRPGGPGTGPAARWSSWRPSRSWMPRPGGPGTGPSARWSLRRPSGGWIRGQGHVLRCVICGGDRVQVRLQGGRDGGHPEDGFRGLGTGYRSIRKVVAEAPFQKMDSRPGSCSTWGWATVPSGRWTLRRPSSRWMRRPDAGHLNARMPSCRWTHGWPPADGGWLPGGQGAFQLRVPLYR